MKTVRGRRNEIDFPLLLFGLRDRPGKPRSTPFCKARPGAHRADAAAHFALCLANEAHLCVCPSLPGLPAVPPKPFSGRDREGGVPLAGPRLPGSWICAFLFCLRLDAGRWQGTRSALSRGRRVPRSGPGGHAVPRRAGRGLGSRPLSCSLTALGPSTAGRQLPPRHVVPLVGGPGWSCFAEGEGGARPPWLSGQGEVGPESSRGL